jgi:hypothetical protein
MTAMDLAMEGRPRGLSDRSGSAAQTDPEADWADEALQAAAPTSVILEPCSPPPRRARATNR